jgi:hypothetical protein
MDISGTRLRIEKFQRERLTPEGLETDEVLKIVKVIPAEQARPLREA